MRLITNTNILIDDFNYCKSFPSGTFVHFLTHFHHDHWQGLTPLWDYGLIYCTRITKLFILNKFPKAAQSGKRIVECQYNKEYKVKVGIQCDQQMEVSFWMFDAKHIPGAAMVLFQGYMGRILFTGDFRYHPDMIIQNPKLFPNSSKHGAQSIHIDQLIFDNTYCNQMFDFGTQEKIFKDIASIIQQNSGKRCLIAMGALGKQKLLEKISKYFQCLICVSEQKYKQIEIAGGLLHILTTNPKQTFIQLVKKKHRAKRIQWQLQQGKNDFICIETDFLMLNHKAPDRINYIVPYSLHSNFKEMSEFIRLIRPAILRKIVIPYQNFRIVKLKTKIDNRQKFAKYLSKLQNIDKSQSGYSYLVKNFTDITLLSAKYLKWMQEQNQQRLLNLLGLNIQADHNLRKRKIDMKALEQQQQARALLKIKKESLSNIAGQLNAVNNNLSLQETAETEEQSKNQKKFHQLYDEIFKQQ